MGVKKKEILLEIDNILNEYVVGSKIYFDETKKLVKLLKHIDKYKQAISYSNHFVIQNRQTKGRKYKCLCIKLYNGKAVPITKTSIKKFGNKTKKRELVLQEMRTVIEPQIEHFRRSRGAYGKHIDHVEKSFIELACNWVMKEEFTNFDGVPGKRYGDYKWKMPPDVEQSWYDYHKENALLKSVPAHINLSEGTRGYKSPF